jgi:hypothetical protein
MITIDPKSQILVANSKPAKSSRKEANSKIKFATNSKAKEAFKNKESNEVVDISPMLFLQEIDEHQEDIVTLKEFSKKALKCLKNLQIALLNNQINSNQLHNLKDVIQNNNSKFYILELSNLADEIKLRIEVEIAKIESSVN